MEEALNIILDTEQPIIKRRSKLERIITKITKILQKEEPIEIKQKKKNQNIIEELFGYDYNTIMTDNRDETQNKKKFKAKRKKRRR